MQLPTGIASSKYNIVRSDMDQRQIIDLANSYFTKNDQALLRQYLAKPNILYDANEIILLKTRAISLESINSTTAYDNAVLYMPELPRGIVQFYDYCLTIDHLKSTMRMLYTHIVNNKLIADDLFTKLESQVMYPSMIPTMVNRYAPEFQTANKELYSITKRERPDWTAPVRGTPIQKTALDFALDEAYFLNSPIMASMQALSQGLFIVHETVANYLSVTADAVRGYIDVAHQTIEGNWINAFFPRQAALSYQTLVASGALTQAGVTFSVNSNGNFPDDVCLLQAKYTNWEEYLGYISTRFNVAGAAPAVNTTRFPGQTLRPDAGGAIGYYIRSQDGGGNDFPGPALEVCLVKPENIWNAMKKLYYHPISSCVKLAEAYIQSGMHSYLMDMLLHLQRALEAASKHRNSESLSSGFNVTNLAKIQQVSDVIPQCGTGYTAQYFKENGPGQFVAVSEDEALVTRDGKIELASHISRNKIECVPRVTVAQLGGKATLDNLKFNAVVVPDSSERRETPPVLFDNISTFTTDNSAVNNVYGATMNAYLVEK